MALDLVLAALKMSPHNISEAIRIVNYNLKKYYKAYKSHRKKKEKQLKDVEIYCRSPG